MDRSGERGGQALLRRRPHEVAVADEHLVAGSLLGRAENQGRLPVAPRRVHEDVPVSACRRPAPALLTIGKSPVERERAEGERVRMAHNIMERYIRCSRTKEIRSGSGSDPRRRRGRRGRLTRRRRRGDSRSGPWRRTPSRPIDEAAVMAGDADPARLVEHGSAAQEPGQAPGSRTWARTYRR